jgi:hypothetical protein
MIDFFIKSPFLLTKGILPHLKSQRWGVPSDVASAVTISGQQRSQLRHRPNHLRQRRQFAVVANSNLTRPIMVNSRMTWNAGTGSRESPK